MATVYLWKPKVFSASVGHISLQLNDGTYISHWPVSYPLTASKKGASLQDDEVMEKRPFDEKIIIPANMINQAGIKKWLEKDYPKYYRLTEQNCARVVHDALRGGGLPILRESKLAVAGAQVHYEDDTVETTLRKQYALEDIKAARKGGPLPKDVDILAIMTPAAVFSSIKEAVQKGK